MNDPSRPILITGATGFLGSWIVSTLLGHGVAVVATDIGEKYDRLRLLMPEVPENLVDFRKCDVADGEAVDRLVAETQPSAIIHLAALQIPHCRVNPAAGAMVNIVGHINLMEAARKRGIGRFIYTSSIAAKPRGPANAPSNLYGVFKKTDEEIARIYWQDFDLPSLGLRPYIIYGIGRDEGETSAITGAIRAAALGEAYEIPFTTTGCFQYAGEVADIFVRACLASWDGAQLSDLTDEVHSTGDVIDAIRKHMPGARIACSPEERVSPASGFETAPLHAIIGDWARVSLQEGVRMTLEQFRRIHRAA